MLNYIVRRLMMGVVTLLAITALVYGLIRNIPGDPVSAQNAMNVDRKISKEMEDQQRRLYRLDRPWPVAYALWMSDLARGDLGTSIARNIPVARLIQERVGPTLLLSSASLLLTYLLAIPLGLWSTVRAGQPDERFLGTLLYMLYSLPAFVAALFLQIVFAVQWDILPLRGMTGDQFDSLPFWGRVWDLFLHALLPVTCYTYGALAYYTRFIRANMQEVIRQDYIRTALAKGVSPTAVVVKHAFRNTLIPLVTLMGLTLPSLLSGSVILEQIFAWPGMGRLFFEAILERDYPTIMGLTLMFSLLTLAGQLLADVLYAVVDPRVTLD
ncbi:ABC transporter permease [bacterium]|nr:ABC transporter permease [bacterium]